MNGILHQQTITSLIIQQFPELVRVIDMAHNVQHFFFSRIRAQVRLLDELWRMMVQRTRNRTSAHAYSYGFLPNL